MFPPSVTPAALSRTQRTARTPTEPVRTQRATTKIAEASVPPSGYATQAPRQAQNPEQNTARPRRPARVAVGAPAPASAQTVLYMEGGGTKPPTYVPSPQFMDIDAEHGKVIFQGEFGFLPK